MPGRSIYASLVCMALADTVSGCNQPATVDLATSLTGVEKSKFVSCSGPPLLEYTEGGQDRMSFVTDLRRGSTIGVASPAEMAPESCLVDAVFQNDRLIRSNFSGSLAMCNLVFRPCLQL
jgi:hypothetical protein